MRPRASSLPQMMVALPDEEIRLLKLQSLQADEHVCVHWLARLDRFPQVRQLLFTYVYVFHLVVRSASDCPLNRGPVSNL